MTTNRLFSAVLIVTLVLSAVAAGAGGAAAQVQNQEAELEIQQPHYIDEGVQTTNENGTRVYLARGERLEIRPVLINDSDVVAFGVESDSGRLTYDETFNDWIFRPSATGTHELYWVTEKQVTREEGNETVTETQQTRHTANVRIEGGLNIDHKPAEDMSQTREDAQKWRDWNATVQELRGESIMVDLGLSQPPSTDQMHQKMVTAYLTIHDPLAVMTGNYTQIVMLIVMSPGGWLFLLTVILPLVAVIALTQRKNITSEIVEADEGTLAKRVADFEWKQALQAFSNKNFSDIWNDDHYASAMRRIGETPLEAFENREAALPPRNVFHDRLQAMAAVGYVAVVEERLAPDGGESTTDTSKIEKARVVHEDDVEDGQEAISLEVPLDDPLLDALDWDQFEIWEFDLVDAEFDRSQLQTPTEEYDLESLIEQTELDIRHFDDMQAASDYMADFYRDIREHPFTDEKGVPDTTRYILNQHLREAQLLSDRFEMPVQYRAELWERALVEYDQGEQAEQTLEQIRDGGYSD